MKTLSALPGAAVLLRAWRVTKSVAADVCWITQVGQGQWNRVLDMVSRIRGLGMEVSCLQQLHTCLYTQLAVSSAVPYLAPPAIASSQSFGHALDLEKGAEHQNLKQ